MRTTSIRSQLLLWLLLPLFSLSVLTTGMAYKLAAESAERSLDEFLANSADSIVARVVRNKNGVLIADLPAAAQSIIRHNGKDKFYYQIVDSRGHRLSGDSELPMPREVRTRTIRFRYCDYQGERVRICKLAVDSSPVTNTIWVQVAETLKARQILLQQIFLSVLVPQLALLGIASLSVWFGIDRGLTPLNRLGRLLRERSKLDLSPVNLGSGISAELIPVADAVNALLVDADKHIQNQKQFIANAAHQLRTPMTALKANADYLQRMNRDARLDTGLAQMVQATDRTVHLIHRLLTLARTTDNSVKLREILDLSLVVDHAATGIVQEARSREIELHFDFPEAPVLVFGNHGELEELVSNLLENAVKYTTIKGSVWVTVFDTEPPGLLIEDNGPGISDEEKPKVFERFYRGTTTRGVVGCGLGLAIVSEIAAASDIDVLLSDRKGGGTSIQLTFRAKPPKD